MTAGQIAAPYRKAQAPLLAAALAGTFAIGLLTGLAAPHAVGQNSHPAVVARAGSSGSSTVAKNTIQAGAARALGATIDEPAASTTMGTLAVLARTLRNIDPELRIASSVPFAVRTPRTLK